MYEGKSRQPVFPVNSIMGAVRHFQSKLKINEEPVQLINAPIKGSARNNKIWLEEAQPVL
jgi:hypothetical protein